MRYVKMLALAAVAVGALMAFVGAGTASASKLCSTKVEPCPAGQHWPSGTEFDFSLLGSSAETDTAGEPINTCTESTIKKVKPQTQEAQPKQLQPILRY